MLRYESNSLTDTESIGKKIAPMLHGGDLVLLSGDLGAGKTSLVKGIAKAIGIKDTVTSPTFAIMNEYPVQDDPSIQTFLHIDTYRLEEAEELLEIGFEDYLQDEHCLILIEWPDKIQRILDGKNFYTITIKQGEANDDRIISLTHSTKEL